MTDKQAAAAEKVFRDADKKEAWSEAVHRRQAVLQKTANLRALRLEKEAADRLEQAAMPKKPARRKPARRATA